MADEKLEAHLKFVMDDDGAVGVRDLAGNVKMLATAAEVAADRAKRMGQEFAKSASGAAVPLWGNPGRRVPISEEVQAAKEQARLDREYQQTFERTTRSMELRKRLQADLRRAGYGPAERGWASGVGEQLGVSGLTGQLTGAAGKAGVAAALTYLLKQGIDQATEIARINASPWATSYQKQEQTLRSLPIAGYAIRTAEDLGGLTAAGMQQQALHERQMARDELDSRRRQIYATAGVGVEVARARAGALSNFSYSPRGDHDRGTWQGERAFQEEGMTLPGRQQAEFSQAQLRASENELGTLQSAEAKAKRDYDDVRRQWEEAYTRVRDFKQEADQGPRTIDYSGSGYSSGPVRNRSGGFGPMPGDVFDHKELANEEERLRTRKNELDQIYTDAGKATAEAMRKRDAAASTARQDQLRLREDDYRIAAFREDRSTSQAQRLGRMSDAERAQNFMALEMVRANKDNLGQIDGRIRQQAEAAAPEEVGKMYEERGKSLMAEARGRAGEYDTDLDAARKARREAGRARDEAAAGNVRLDASQVIDSGKKLFDTLVAQIVRALEDKDRELKAKGFQKNASPNQTGASP